MKSPVSLASAEGVIDAARKTAESLGVPVSIAVVDAETDLVTFVRMDGAPPGGVEFARDKASTARANGKDSGADGPLGGVPLAEESGVVGAVGVSGGSPDQDEAVARAGAEAFEAGR